MPKEEEEKNKATEPTPETKEDEEPTKDEEEK